MTLLLLKILRPKDIPNRTTDWNWRVRFYNWLLVRLMPLYRRGAISETINLDATQIIHNVRDYWYEQELQRFHIDTAQHLEKQSAPFCLNRKYRRSCLFKWSESLLVFNNGGSFNVSRAKKLTIETDINGQLKISSDKDFIFRLEFTANNKGQSNSNIYEPNESFAPEPPPPPKPNDYQPKQKIPVKDTIPLQSLQNTTTKHHGFEENDIF